MEDMVPRRRSTRLRNATPLKLPAQKVAQLESVTESHSTSEVDLLESNQNISLVPKTPVTTSRIRPAPEEMHPSKVHQSTTQEPDSGLRLGFTDIKTEGSGQPSGITQKSPSKINIARSSFDFRFARPGLHLGPEAQRIMDELNEEALRIKAKLAAEREEKKRMATCDEQKTTQRQTKPKCEVGRFSDAHKAEFKKMDSIAGHPSAFRAQLSRAVPVKNNLKRSSSKAQLDTNYADEKVHKSGRDKVNLYAGDRHQDNQPMKIARKQITDDISSASRKHHLPFTLDILSSQSKIPSATVTPTQASLSRSRFTNPTPRGPTSWKSPQKNKTPKPLHLEAKNTINCDPCKPDRLKCSLTSSKVTTEPVAFLNITNRKCKNDLQKVFSSISNPDSGIGNSNKLNFTPKTIDKHAVAAQNSPSPIRSFVISSNSKINLSAKSLNVGNINAPKLSQKVEYPSLSDLQSPHHNLSQDRQPSSIPGTFTFRSDQSIKFLASPNKSGSSLVKNRNPQAPENKASELMADNFLANDKENKTPNLLISPEISNKRRKRLDSDDGQTERFSKKPKKQDTKSTIPRLKGLQGSVQKMRNPQKKPGVLSLSRLNMLSRPKIRR